MCFDFLNNAMRGTTHLEGIRETYYTARKASGHNDPYNITFKEYIKRLTQAAQPHEASFGQSRGRGSWSANVHSILGGESDQEDGSKDEDDPQGTLEVYQLNRDQNGNQSDNWFYKKPGTLSKQCAIIPRSKWNVLSPKDQIAWAKLSEEANK